NVAVGADFLKERVLIDLPVDGNGRACLQVRQERWILFAQARKKLAHICSLELEFAHATSELTQVADQGHIGHRVGPARAGRTPYRHGLSYWPGLAHAVEPSRRPTAGHAPFAGWRRPRAG